jgi:sugar phosphate isomerase/epimerase
VSTRLYQARRLQRDHLVEIAAHGFEAVEVDAASGHFDAGNPAAVADLQQWLAEARLELSAVSVGAAPPGPHGGDAPDDMNALQIARRIPVNVMVVPVGAPREAAKRIERLAEAALPLGGMLAIDSRSPSMSPHGSLLHFVERGDDARVGIALDCASAAKLGDLSDAIEQVSEHLAAVRLPIDSAIDWSLPMTTLQKVGYEGPLTFDAAPQPARPAVVGGAPKQALARARKAREKMERWLTSI